MGRAPLDRERRARLPQIIGAATAIFLHRLTGAEDLIFGLAVGARDNVSRSIPGIVSNVLPLRLAVHPSMTVSEVIGQTDRQIRRALEHQRYQIARFATGSGGIVDGRTLFGWASTPCGLTTISVLPATEPSPISRKRAVRDLSIAVYDRSDGGPFRIDFDADPTLYSRPILPDISKDFSGY